jgi:anthranilate phosphoribosyltransferase
MPLPFRDVLLKLCRTQDLSREEAHDAFAFVMSGEASDSQIAGLLVGLAAKGSTVDELVGAASVMREKAVRLACNDDGEVILDTCGTGGDIKGTFNISTAAAIITAAAGVRVVKHGNRSASSKAGSADVLEKLGVHLELTPDQLRKCVGSANICFAFARVHHPIMKNVAHVRTSLGIPTIFNMLAPLMNPARARHQLLGVFSPELTERLALVLRELDSRRAWVVHAEDGLDELSTMSPTRISELKDGQVKTWQLDSRSLGLSTPALTDLQVSTVDQAAHAIHRIVDGEKGPMRDIAALNAAGALVISEKCPDLKSGLALAMQAIDSGAARRTLDALVAASGSHL